MKRGIDKGSSRACGFVQPAVFGLCALIMAVSGLVHAQTDAELLSLRQLVASCANCHGTDGRAASPAVMPTLSDQTPQALLSQLLAYRGGRQAGTIMPQIAKGYSEAQLSAIAHYLGKN